jgi:F-type H+-transporting ATPase subunit epsilon
MTENRLTLEVVTPDRQVVHEAADFIQLPALDGYIGILPGHTPLLTEMGAGIITIRMEAEERYATAVGGFAEVLADRVIILAERSELAEEIDVGRARAAEQRALQRLQEKAEKVDFERARLALQRSLARIAAAELAQKIHISPRYPRRGIVGGATEEAQKTEASSRH